MRKILSIVIVLLIMSCSKETSNFTLKGHVKGLKKGTVYLEREQDSTYKIIDSIVINGNPQFELHCNLEEPEVLFLRLNKNDNNEGIITFFADKGITEINSTLKNFNFDAKIKGSKQQELLEEYLTMISKFNDKNLDLIKAHFEPKKENDTTSGLDFESKYNSLLRRKYLYTINFAVTHNESEVAPYLAITQIANANPKFLDTIYNSLEANLKTSRYGKQLKAFIDNQKQ
ncbi:MAG TPA: DUF4369 domain-containing protein [Flavobacteriaceae bacterium]